MSNDVNVEVLVSAVNADEKALAESIHLETTAVIVNQCNVCETTAFSHNGRNIKCISMKDRGVGLSRNTALMNASEEICLFCDEDITLYHGYEQMILDGFRENPSADLLLFNVKVDERRKTYYNNRKHRVRWYNYGRYPAYAVAVKRTSLLSNRITFSLLFGGGAKYSNGEDSLFLHDCLKSGLRIYTETREIGQEKYRESTWFHGYTEKFFHDRGVLYHFLYNKLAILWSLQFLFRKRKIMCKDIPFRKAFALMLAGIKEAKAL